MSKEASISSLQNPEKVNGLAFTQTDASDIDVAACLAGGGQGDTISEADALRIRFVVRCMTRVSLLMTLKETYRLAHSASDVLCVHLSVEAGR